MPWNETTDGFLRRPGHLCCAEHRHLLRRLAERSATPHLDERAFRAAKAALRMRMRAGEITPGQYQCELGPLQGLREARRAIVRGVETGLADYVMARRGATIPGGLAGRLVARFLGPTRA